METPACQVPKNLLLLPLLLPLLLVVWCLRCNNQKEGETKDSPSNQREEALGPGKKNENRADDSVRIGKNTFNYHYYIIICYYYLLVAIRLIHPLHSLVMYR